MVSLLLSVGILNASPLDVVRKAFIGKTIENYAYSDSEQEKYLRYSEKESAHKKSLSE